MISLQNLKRIYHQDGDGEHPTRFSIDSDIATAGGRLIVVVNLYDHSYNYPHIGTAVCHPKDRYNRQQGERLALQRAFHNWCTCNIDLVIRYALAMDINAQDAIKRLWKHLGADIYYTTRKEITDGRTVSTTSDSV